MVLIRDLYLITDHVPLEMYTWKRIWGFIANLRCTKGLFGCNRLKLLGCKLVGVMNGTNKYSRFEMNLGFLLRFQPKPWKHQISPKVMVLGDDQGARQNTHHSKKKGGFRSHCEKKKQEDKRNPLKPKSSKTRKWSSKKFLPPKKCVHLVHDKASRTSPRPKWQHIEQVHVWPFDLSMLSSGLKRRQVQ